ncbi:zinc ABC transporter solute-binding protein, partial [Xanthomonas citri pv. citri]|nr:zinc ABC transporter solute-binding protein [Xanthomonas citri pv. citri]
GSSEKPTVLTTFTVLQDMTAAVAGEHVSVESITKPGAEIHDYEPTPQDVTKASRADLVLDNGLHLEQWLEQFTSSANLT